VKGTKSEISKKEGKESQRKQALDGRRGKKKVQNVLCRERERQSSTCGMAVAEKERGEKGTRETLNEGGREIRRIKEIWKEEGKKRKRKEMG
jgi:hypothetical protein